MRLTRHSALIGAAVMMLLAASCGSDDNNSSASTAGPTTAPTAASEAPTTTASAASTPDTSTPATEGSTAASEPAASGTTLNLKTSSLGDMIVDQDGKTLYIFQKDTQGQQSVCNAGCDGNWPALTATAVPAVGTGLDAEDVTLIARADGTMQVAFYGWPLYYFANDAAPGDTNGQGVGGIWWVVDAEGNPIGAT